MIHSSRHDSETVFDFAADHIVHGSVPPVKYELETKIARLVALPPGPVDAAFSLEKTVIDVNLMPLFATASFNSGREQFFLTPGGSFALYPSGTSGRVKFTNHFPRCLIEINRETLEEYVGDVQIFLDLEKRQTRYVVDHSAASASSAALNYLTHAHTESQLVAELTINSFVLSVLSRAVVQFGSVSHQDDTTPKKGRQDLLVLIALRFIHNKISNPNLRAQDVADCVSEDCSVFNIEFQNQVSMELDKYIHETRVLLAESQIKRGKIALVEIARQTGFQDVKRMMRSVGSGLITSR